MIFQVQDISKRFGGLQALSNVSFQLQQQQVLGIIGPNGAGKTTFFNVINGLMKSDSGVVELHGENITGMPPHVICHKGLARTFQIAQPFREMTVTENVITAALCKTDRLDEAEQTMTEVLKRCGLSSRAGILTKNLTTIDQRRLELAKAVATKPSLILLDEIMAGLTRNECETAVDLIRSIMETGVSILMVEHVMKAVMALCHRIVVLKQGTKIAEGTPEEIANSEVVIDAYLGKGHRHASSN